jgi:hypothetical protein
VGNTGLMNEHGLSESGEHKSETEDRQLPSNKKAHPRRRTRVLNKENQRLEQVKTKSKHP